MAQEAKGPRKRRGSQPSKPAVPSSTAREQARLIQRIALSLAMIEAIAANGYRATRVADVISRAGVSRKTFYKHFANKEECLLVTFDLVSEAGIHRVEHAYRETEEPWPAGVEVAIRTLFESVIENPGALRLTLIEIGTVGPAGIERRERSLQRYERFIREVLRGAPGKGDVSDATLKAVVGGLNRILYRRVARGEHEELLALVPDLITWATSYYPSPPAILHEPRPAESPPRPALTGGRAPGTLAPHAPLARRRGLPRGEQNVSRSFVIHSQRERILDAVANLTAEAGYAQLKVEGIAEAAAVSLNAFYEHFEDKEDAFLVTYEVGHSKGLASAERAYADESDWRLGVRAAIAALFEFLASEPAFAHVALIDALTATAATAERSNIGVMGFAQMLLPGLEDASGQNPPAAAVAIEAVVGGIFELCLQYAMQDRIHALPELVSTATYVALAPFLGGEQAARIATGQDPGGERKPSAAPGDTPRTRRAAEG